MVNENLITEILNVRAFNGSPEARVADGISKSIYPFDYNKNDPMQGFNEWQAYIHAPQKSKYDEFVEYMKDLNEEIEGLETRFEQQRILTNAYHIINR